MKVSVIGLGRLGLPMACFYASKGHEVVGIDVNEKILNLINDGKCPINETGLDRLMKQVDITATANYETMLGSEIIFILVATPSDEDDKFDNKYVVNVVDTICEVYKDKSEKPLIVLTSTVMPGSCAEVFKPKLDLVFEDTDLCYNPEFVALGDVLKGMANPDSILIGESSKKAGDRLVEFYSSLLFEKEPPICRMNLWNAELAKLSLNVALTMKITYANTIADLCEEIPQGNVDVVTNFVGLDSRIGNKYLKGGMASGGVCLPRDVRAMVAFGEGYDLDLLIQRDMDLVNSTRAIHIGNRIEEILDGIEEPIISIFGLTFKPNTPEVIESTSIALAQYLSELYKVKVYDPMGLYGAIKYLDNKVEYHDTPHQCVKNTDLCIIATAWEEFKRLYPNWYKKLMRTPNVYDCWRIYDKKNFDEQRVNYYAVGLSNH